MYIDSKKKNFEFETRWGIFCVKIKKWFAIASRLMSISE